MSDDGSPVGERSPSTSSNHRSPTRTSNGHANKMPSLREKPEMNRGMSYESQAGWTDDEKVCPHKLNALIGFMTDINCHGSLQKRSHSPTTKRRSKHSSLGPSGPLS